MKYAPLVLKHLRKNWIRTLSTVLAMAVCIFLICTLQTVVDAVNYGLHAGQRLAAGDAPLREPGLQPAQLLQEQDCRHSRREEHHHRQLVWRHLSRRLKYFFANLAVEPEPFLQIYPEIMLPEDQKQAWFHDGTRLHHWPQAGRKMGLEGRRHFELESFIPPYRVGKPFEFVVDGIYDTDPVKYPGTDLNSMYFNYKYLYEATGQRAGIGTLTDVD